MPTPTLKPLARQKIVIVGATSGIGLVTARMAARAGATLFLIARNEDALKTLTAEIVAAGGTAAYAVADVADEAQVAAAAKQVRQTFGVVDSWVNDAGAFAYGALDVVPLDDQRRIFDVVYWGTVHGSLAAERALAHRGALINVGSVLGEVAIPYQGPYCAAKFAVKGFTEAFRRELRARGRQISITLIKPAAINTPYMEHARNRIGSAGTRNPPPAYDPALVARAILYACENRVRDLTIGGAGGVALVLTNILAPRLMDRVTALIGKPSQTSADPGDPARRDNLYQPRADLAERSTLKPFTRKTSLALEAQLHPEVTAMVTGIALALGALALRPRRAAASGGGPRDAGAA